MRSDAYQYVLIAAGIAVTVCFGVFWYRELFPEYKIYQNDYVALEKFRSTYTGEPPPDFKEGVKQIVFEREDKGPPEIDRCITCHVALQFPDFSPTKLQLDVNGQIALDSSGKPVQIPNENYVWDRLDAEIERLIAAGKTALADQYRALKTAQVSGDVLDVTKVLRMHPLMGRETRPFEYHPIEEFGCTTCHSGNGRGLTTEKAHGPVYDGQYHIEFRGPVPKFTEADPLNDPDFARIFNSKPGHELLFQTTPIFVGSLIQAKCMNCHQSSGAALQSAADRAGLVTNKRTALANAIKTALSNENFALISLLNLRLEIQKSGLAKTLAQLKSRTQDFTQPKNVIDSNTAQIAYLSQLDEKKALAKIDKQINDIIGSETLAQQLEKQVEESGAVTTQTIDAFVAEHRDDPDATGSLFNKVDAIDLEIELLRHVSDTEQTFEKTVSDQNVINAMQSDIDMLTQNYTRGQELYISQACYACHRIAGFTRGGVGPELTREGKSYPWFIKESIVWPQADLPTSTMPNYRMDHEDVEDLMTFLLGQVGERKSIAETTYKVSIQEWEAGKKLPWEQAITPDRIMDLRYSMTVFATQGCAACHRLEGFESNVGYSIEKQDKEKPSFADLYKEREWFTQLFPEEVLGSQLVRVIEKNSAEIDKRIVQGVRQGSIIEEIDKIIPGQVESLYTNFKYASRAKDHYYKTLAAQEKDPNKKSAILEAHNAWKDRVHRVLMMYIQEYGLGRLIGPRPNWSGVFRTDEWLMEHFHNPAGHVPRSIMPVLPFDDTKFYALTHMLDVLGKRNRDRVRSIWDHRGFSPEQAFQIHCAQCHGNYLQGNGPVATWIYPIPKNLRNADFLRNLTKERVIQSITHGVKGTPMPPWGEIAAHKPMMNHIPVLTDDEISQIADWIFSFLPGGTVIKESKDVPKWNYSPEDVLRELEREGNELKGGEKSAKKQISIVEPTPVLIAKADDIISPSTISVDNVFDVEPNPITGTDENVYYIKKKYYTEENIEQGKAFFEMNCAVCHGAEADGTGPRASEMKDAKPRMLINLDWGEYRDDLRLLRSIKYGVPGTAMTPWGDLTSSLQRLQLVIFIRSLSQEHRLRESLFTTLYKAFDHSILAIENARIHEYPDLAKDQELYTSIRAKRQSIEGDQAKSKEALDLYQQQLTAWEGLKKHQNIDRILTNLKNEVANEKEIDRNMGLDALKLDNEADFATFLKIIEVNDARYQFDDSVLEAKFDGEQERQTLGQKIIKNIDAKLDALAKEKIITEGKIASTERAAELEKIANDSSALEKIKIKLISGLEEGVRSRKKQQQLYEEYKKEGSQKPTGDK